MAAMLAEAAALMNALPDEAAPLGQSQDNQPALLFCGDLNSDLNDGVPGTRPAWIIPKSSCCVSTMLLEDAACLSAVRIGR